MINFLLESLVIQKNLNDFINSADNFTIETENIPFTILKKIASKKKIFPDPEIVKICQNRLRKKNFLIH